MNVSADTYLIISLMFAVFAAVAAVGTSIVLGAGFERLRAGFEIVRKQTGFFATAIHKLDQKTQSLDKETGELKHLMTVMSDQVERVEKQTSFFADNMDTLEIQKNTTEKLSSAKDIKPDVKDGITTNVQDMQNADISTLLHNIDFLNNVGDAQPNIEQNKQEALESNILLDYMSSEARPNTKSVTYH